jgi:RNA polymerase sigma-70 factor (ECF subfamily)
MDGLFRFLVWLTGHRQDAEDALQEVLVRGFRAFDKLRERDKFKSWIYKIAANTGRTFARKRRRGMKTFGAQPFDDAKVALLGSEAPVPFAQLQEAEADEKLARALETLEPELREPLLLHTLSGMKYREVAETLGWPIGTVTTRIHVARERLAKLLK